MIQECLQTQRPKHFITRGFKLYFRVRLGGSQTFMVSRQTRALWKY